MEKKYFYGNEVSDYGMEHGRVDYRCLAKAFDVILNNNIMEKTYNIGCWELENGGDCHHEDSNGNIYYGDDYEEVLNELNSKLEEFDEKYDNLDELYGESDDDSEEEKILIDKMKAIEQEADSIKREINLLENEYYDEVYQWYIIDDNGADILKRETHEIVYYNEELDMYLWGVTHCGTGWDYVLTEIAC